jgi:hypothetical protein
MTKCAAAPRSIFLEFGVYTGNSATGRRHSRSRFFGFDSFEGLPENWTRNWPKGNFSTDGTIPQIDDERIGFVKGWFQNTLPIFLKGFVPRSRLVVHSDNDLYSSTLFTLATLNRLLIPGTVIIFDDFSVPTHVFRAFAACTSAFMRSAHPVAMTSHYAEQAAFVFNCAAGPPDA